MSLTVVGGVAPDVGIGVGVSMTLAEELSECWTVMVEILTAVSGASNEGVGAEPSPNDTRRGGVLPALIVITRVGILSTVIGII